MKLLTNINRTPDLLPHFLDHYSRIGVSHFSISVDGAESARMLPKVRRICRGYDCDVFCGPDDGRMLYIHRSATIYGRLATGFSDGEWYAFADIDEMVDLPKPLLEMLAEAEAGGFTSIGGTLIDRIAEDGTLPHVRADDVGQQFPLAGDFTQRVLRAPVSKVMFFRWPNAPTLGHHSCVDRKPSYGNLSVYHFKWTDGAIDAIRLRADAFKSRTDTRLGMIDQRTLWYFDRLGGRFDLNDSRVMWRNIIAERQL